MTPKPRVKEPGTRPEHAITGIPLWPSAKNKTPPDTPPPMMRAPRKGRPRPILGRLLPLFATFAPLRGGRLDNNENYIFISFGPPRTPSEPPPPRARNRPPNAGNEVFRAQLDFQSSSPVHKFDGHVATTAHARGTGIPGTTWEPGYPERGSNRVPRVSLGWATRAPEHFEG